MLITRAAKIAMVAAIAAFATLVAFGNITDYETNFAFVQHVLSMDTVFPRSTITYRAIADPALHRVAYAIIIAAEALTAVLCWIGVKAGQDEALMKGELHRISLWLGGALVVLGGIYYLFVHRHMKDERERPGGDLH